ncbi:hypothetical protein T4A_4612 [Trichinella pseudospiralis]|nr:hypothetical protein T4A_4612 [Trichinella pseudospiralis]KRZ41579.1 hypothetical protein T4C_13234 [Trichinella pseudospiralis]
MVRWGSGSKPPPNKPLIYGRAASRGIVTKTIEGSNFSRPTPLHHCGGIPLYIGAAETIGSSQLVSSEGVSKSCGICGLRRVVREEANLENDDTKGDESSRRSNHGAKADELARTRRQSSGPPPCGW